MWCHVISIAHVEDLEELEKKDIQTFELAAVCDIQQERDENNTPISSAERGLEALGVVFAALEPTTIGQSVKVKDIINGENIHMKIQFLKR